MNTYITKTLAKIKTRLSTEIPLNSKSIDDFISDLEMIKMEIEQHISNMPKVSECKASLSAAKNAVKKLTEIIVLAEELNDSSNENNLNTLDEILVSIDDIHY